MHAGLRLLLFWSVYSYQLRSEARNGLVVQNPEQEWERMSTIMGEEGQGAAPEESGVLKSAKYPSTTAASFPEYKRIPISKYQKDVFKPEKGTRPLPAWAGEILLVPSSTGSNKRRPVEVATGKVSPLIKYVEVLCHVDRIYVRIRREVFKSNLAYKYLKFGTCPVNQGTKAHYYFLYLLKTDCGFKMESNPDHLSITNKLHYKPSGPVLREMPFNVCIHCKYHRLFHSYKTGFSPKLQGGTFFKALQPKLNIILIAIDASGNEIPGPKTYLLGEPMYFKAKQPNNTADSGDRRMYVTKCFMTPNQYSNSNPKYTVIDNQGCMIDSKLTGQSKFISSTSKMVQKFSVGAFIFNDDVIKPSVSKQLYMHCEVSVGKRTPTPKLKACNYDQATKKWKELYGDDSVCTCCETSCPSLARASSKTISSPSWRVSLSRNRIDEEPMTFDADTLNLEDPDMMEDSDFLNYWEHDY